MTTIDPQPRSSRPAANAMLMRGAGILMLAYVLVDIVSTALYSEWDPAAVFDYYSRLVSGSPVLLLSFVVALVGGILAFTPQNRIAPWVMLAALLLALVGQYLAFDPDSPGSDRLLLTLPGIGLVFYVLQVRTMLVPPYLELWAVGGVLWQVSRLLLLLGVVLALIALLKKSAPARAEAPVDGPDWMSAPAQDPLLADQDPDVAGVPVGWTPAPQASQTPQTPLTDASGEPVSDKSRLVAFLLCFFLGTFGIHRFYVGKTGTGIAMILTCGGLGIWGLVDLIVILAGSFRDIDNRRVLTW